MGRHALALGLLLAFVAAAHAATPADLMKALGLSEMRQPTPVPEITVTLVSGRTLAMASLRGKLVLVNFWATWCVPCQWEMPLMERFYRKYRDRGFTVLAISLDQGPPEVVRAFVRDRQLTYPVALDPRHEAARSFGIVGLPATFLVGPDGVIKGVTYGPREWDGKEAQALIAALLSERPR